MAILFERKDKGLIATVIKTTDFQRKPPQKFSECQRPGYAIYYGIEYPSSCVPHSIERNDVFKKLFCFCMCVAFIIFLIVKRKK